MTTKSNALRAILTLVAATTFAPLAMAQESLPFPPVPSGSKAARTMQESTYSPLPVPKRLPAGAPNILIILIDDAGPALPSTYGGDINTPTLSRIANSGVSFNRFHTTAMCSPTRAALLTGHNHHRVGAGQIASLANDWDGYSGMWPATGASIAKVLGYYGYATSAFGKWHNTPHADTLAGRSVRTLADRPPRRLRLFLRLPRGGVVAMGTGACRELQSHRDAAPQGLSPDRGPGRQGRCVDAPAARARARPAVPDVLGARRRPCPAPHLQGVGGQV